jgi:crotonobetainyl-CoA:carnitine CoA-transferase CaiB-like acyl-CoA transferase
MSANRPTHVLDGYKVLDFTQFIAGPTVTRMMAQMGADVIKVEIAPDGDRTRVLPLVRDHGAAISSSRIWVNAASASTSKIRPRWRYSRNSSPRSTWWWRISRPA